MNSYEVRRYIDRMGVPHGQNVVLPGDIDTSECQEFFGTRCHHNVHVKGRRLAHVDRVDPRKNPIGHLKKDVGIPYSVMTTPIGAAFGAVVSANNRKTGAIVGGLIGFILGAVADNMTTRTDLRDIL